MFQAARYEAGSLDAEGKRFLQWTQLYRRFGLFTKKNDPHLKLLDGLRFDILKNTMDQFCNRLQLFTDILPPNARLLFAVDPAQDTPASRIQLWTQVVQQLPPKVIFLFAQRYKDTLAIDKEFSTLPNVHFIPKLDTGGLRDLTDDETQQLADAYQPVLKDKIANRQALQTVFHQYRNHPYAVHAALNMLLTDSFTSLEQLPQEPMPQSVCPLQWQGVQLHPLRGLAIPLLLSYAVLEVPSLDEMVCWVADISPDQFTKLLADPYIRSLIRDSYDGRTIYHHYFASYIHSLLYTPDGGLTQQAEYHYERALVGYQEVMDRAVKPDPQISVRLCEISLTVGGPMLFAKTLCQCTDAFIQLGYYQTFASLIDRALTLITPKSEEAVDLYFQLGKLRHTQRDYHAALKFYNESLKYARELSDPARVGNVLVGLAKVYWEQDIYNDAESYLQEAKNKFEAIGDQIGLAEVMLLAGQLLSDQRRNLEAERVLKITLQIAQGLHNHRHQKKIMASVHAAWGRLYDTMGQIGQATQEFHKAIDLTKDMYDRKTEADLRFSVSSIFERIGNLREAQENLKQALAMHRDMKLMENLAEDLVGLARISAMQGKHDIADRQIQEAKNLFKQLGNKSRLKELDDDE
jgi:tetratricopeptide (TPR) repeat protein